MGAHRLSNEYSPRLAGLRRVVRRGSTFICGVCRSCYDDEREALSCIDRCWQETLQLDPVVLARRALKVSYRCRFCARDYDTRQAAESCAHDCIAAREKKYAREAALVDVGDLPPAPRRTPRSRPVLMAQAMVMARPLARSKPQVASGAEPAVSESPESGGGTFNADVRLQAPSPAPAVMAREPEASAAPAPKKAKATNDSDKFYRDGAQYVCKECLQKYFTRVEVLSCYDGH